MKILAYNINKSTQEKLDKVLLMEADVFILPEVACPRREDCHVVELGHCRKVLIDDGLVTVASSDSRLQIVRHDGHRRTAEEVEGILAGHDEILFLL